MTVSSIPTKQVQLLRIPSGLPTTEDFAISAGECSFPRDGEVLVRVIAISLDPYLRSAMAGRHLSGAIPPGSVVSGEGLVEVVESAHPHFAAGQHWIAECGWRDHAVLSPTQANAARRVPADLQPQTLALGVLGMPGLTAWSGIRKLSGARPGDTVVVSAASGAVGATAGQLARLLGCRVIGIAGDDEKCSWVTEQARFDACINHRAEDLRAALDRHCPEGVDVYFDNVGGDVLQAIVERLAVGARLVLCGLVSQYNGGPPACLNAGMLIKSRAIVRGLVVYDYWDDMSRMMVEVGEYVRSGTLRYREDINYGLDATPEAFCRLMSGKNQGKSIVIL